MLGFAGVASAGEAAQVGLKAEAGQGWTASIQPHTVM